MAGSNSVFGEAEDDLPSARLFADWKSPCAKAYLDFLSENYDDYFVVPLITLDGYSLEF